VIRLSSPLAASALVAAALCLGRNGTAAASPTLSLDLEALAVRSECIVLGRVEATDSHFVAPRSRYIVTDVTIAIDQRLLGAAEPDRFVVRYLGGEVGDLGQRVFGEASYRVGERVLLFAAKRQGAFYAVGMSQGVLHVRDDGAGVERIGAGAAPRKLDDVLDQVRALVARPLEQGRTR
jgi:hypothetical protein